MLNRVTKSGSLIGRYIMKFVPAKNSEQLLPGCLRVLAMLLILGTFLKVAAFGVGSVFLGGRVEKAVTGFGQNDENVEKSVAKRNQVVKDLKQKNMFAPPAPKPKPPVCTGVLGDTAIINGKAYKAGQEVDGAKIVSIAPTEVMILWKGKEVKLPAFGAGKIDQSASRPVKNGSEKQRQVEPVEQNAVASKRMPRPEGMRIDLRNMSPEEREAYRRARRERRGPGGRERPRDRRDSGDRPRDRREPGER